MTIRGPHTPNSNFQYQEHYGQGNDLRGHDRTSKEFINSLLGFNRTGRQFR